MELPNIRQGIEPELWLKVKISAMKQGKYVYQWLSEAIEQKLKSEETKK